MIPVHQCCEGGRQGPGLKGRLQAAPLISVARRNVNEACVWRCERSHLSHSLARVGAPLSKQNSRVPPQRTQLHRMAQATSERRDTRQRVQKHLSAHFSLGSLQVHKRSCSLVRSEAATPKPFAWKRLPRLLLLSSSRPLTLVEFTSDRENPRFGSVPALKEGSNKLVNMEKMQGEEPGQGYRSLTAEPTDKQGDVTVTGFCVWMMGPLPAICFGDCWQGQMPRWTCRHSGETRP